MFKRFAYNTRFDRWLVAHKVKPARLAYESGYSRQHLLRIRKGEMEPTRRCIAAIVTAARKLSHEAVRAADLFELGESGGGRGNFELLGSYEEFIAQETARGVAITVTDDAMLPVLQKDDVVRVERREAQPDEVLCVQVHGVHYFGYWENDALRRMNGPDVPLDGSERVMGVATAVIDRAVYGMAEQDRRNVIRGGNVVGRDVEERS